MRISWTAQLACIASHAIGLPHAVSTFRVTHLELRDIPEGPWVGSLDHKRECEDLTVLGSRPGTCSLHQGLSYHHQPEGRSRIVEQKSQLASASSRKAARNEHVSQRLTWPRMPSIPRQAQWFSPYETHTSV